MSNSFVKHAMMSLQAGVFFPLGKPWEKSTMATEAVKEPLRDANTLACELRCQCEPRIGTP